MSRCFPFPPPGYERKARNDDGNLLEKDKHRDKKPKKDKKDKDKREGKEKRNKDRSDGKHREKKDKKEKHRDKDRDRDKKRDKEKEADKAREKSKVPDEKRLPGQPDPLGGEKLGQKESREKINSVDKKVPGQIGGRKVEKLTQSSNLVDESKFVKDFGRRIKDDATTTGNHVNSFTPVDRRKDEGLLRFESKNSTTFAAIKETDKRTEVKPTEWKNTTRDGDRPGGNAMVQSTAGTIQSKFGGLPRLLDKSVERKMEGHENPKDRDNDDKRGVKSQEKDKEKKSHGKDKDRDREKKKEDRDKKKEDREKRKAEKQKKKDEKQRKKEEKEKKREAKEKSEVQNAELNIVKGSNQHDTDNHAVKPPQLPKQTNIIAPTEPNPKKRKDFETNGTEHAEDALPNKLPRPSTSSSHTPPLENGRVLEHYQTSVPTPEKKVIPNNTKTENKERKINGITETQPPSLSPMKAKPTIDQTPKPSVRLPHPDVKYLRQIYSVPKIEDFLGYEDDEEEWLFGGVSKKPKVEPSNSEEEMPLVWAEARQIESADIFALPYVVPY